MGRLAAVLIAGVACICACSRSKPVSAQQDGARDAGLRLYSPATGVPGCTLYGAPRQTGTVPAELGELSGLAASTRHEGIFWAHNDSDDAFRVYALEDSGKIRATMTLTGAKPTDLEDIAVGPCEPRAEAPPCLYLADTGDNFQRRKEVRLFRLPEPEQLADATLPVETLAFTYPDGPHNVEALVIDARSGHLAVITKTPESLGDVYSLEGLGPSATGKAVKLGTLRAPQDVDRLTTGADLHPSGERLLLRTYTRAWEVRGPKAQRLQELIAGEVAEVPAASQAQAEAITFTPGGRGYLLGSEFAGQPLYRTDCQ
ncbi:hypothetical protein [Hyalangium minutum]|uniref:Uncharacterized protein n=1 Tax=Hyalangium minutum TaxID=394096 RepID=A0A085WP59_9BACT|nr:hypothetical protein [Hyalangium minutum]KFE69472.1 hypothetical protein DB31_6447 [Hyalangium minutum]